MSVMLYVHGLDEMVTLGSGLEPIKDDLRDECAEFTAGGSNAMCRRAISRWEQLSGNDKCRRVRAKVLEEVGHAVENDEDLPRCCRLDQFTVSEAWSIDQNNIRMLTDYCNEKRDIPMTRKIIVSMQKPKS